VSGAESVVVLRLLRAGEDCLVQQANRSRAIALLMRKTTHEIERVRMVRMLLKDLPVDLRGCLDVTSTVVTQAALDLSIDLIHSGQNNTVSMSGYFAGQPRC